MTKKIANLSRIFLCLMLIIAMVAIGYVVSASDDPTTLRIEDSEVTEEGELFRFQYSGDWRAESGYSQLFSHGDDHYSRGADSYYTMKFIGSRIAIYGTKRSTHGSYKVSIDGIEKGTINADNEAILQQQLLWESDELPNEEHILKVENISTKVIQVDYVEVTYSSVPPTSIAAEQSDVLMEKGGGHQITVLPTPAIASVRHVTYTSEDPSIAAVNHNGLITGKNIGKTKINIAIPNSDLTASVNVEVVKKLDILTASVGDPYRLERQNDYDTLMQQSKRQFREVAWQNDHIVSKINVLSGNQNLTNVRLSCSSFTSGKNKIPADQIKLSWLKWTHANIGSGGKPEAPVELFPDIISDEKSIKLDANSVGFGWLSMDIPANQKPGIYQGVIRVDCNEATDPITLDYEIEVIGLQVPNAEEMEMPIQIWQHPFAVAGYYGLEESDYFTQKHFKYLETSMREYASIGGNDLTTNIVEEPWGHHSYYDEPSTVKWTKKLDGTFSFDYTHFDAWVHFGDQCGIIDIDQKQGRIKCFSMVPWRDKVTYFDEATQSTVSVTLTPGDEEWKNIWTPFIKDFMKHTKSLGVFEMTYIAMDERTIDELAPVVELVKSIKDSNGQSLKLASAQKFVSSDKFDIADQIDDISVGFLYVSDLNGEFTELCEHRKPLGLTTTFYTCSGHYPSNYTISDPGDTYWVMWYTLKEKSDGFLRWAWDNWTADPLDNATYRIWESGDQWFVYPVERGIEHDRYYYTTPRYEMMKVGIKDVRKAKYLMQQDDALANDIRTLLDSLQRPLRGNNAYGAATYASEETRELCLSEGKRMDQILEQYAKSYADRVAPMSKETPFFSKVAQSVKQFFTGK